MHVLRLCMKYMNEKRVEYYLTAIILKSTYFQNIDLK